MTKRQLVIVLGLTMLMLVVGLVVLAMPERPPLPVLAVLVAAEVAFAVFVWMRSSKP